MTWVESELATVADIFNGKTPSRSEQREAGHPVLKIRDVDEMGKFRGEFSSYVDPSLAEANGKKHIRNGDTLILNAAHSATHVASKTFFACDEVSGAMATGEWLIIRPTSDQISSKFVNHWINSEEIRRALRRIVNGIHLYPKDVSQLRIPLPPLDEQRRIAHVLDKADALRRQRQESLQLTEKLLQAVFLEMFGDPVSNSKNLPTEDLSELARMERGRFSPRPRNDPSYYGGQYPFIQTGDITRSRGRITSWTQTLNDKGAAVSKEFRPGTVVIAIVGATIGETAIVETPVYCPDSIIGITPYDKKATPEFIEFLLRLWKPRLRELAPDAARANLNLERLRPLRALAPELAGQQEFTRIARLLRSLVLHKNESLSDIERLFSSMQQRAFRGELDLSRLVLGASYAGSVAIAPDEPFAKPSKLRAAASFLQAPELLEITLKQLDNTVSKGDPIPWSGDYFKYRILGTELPPFSFADLRQKAESVFEVPVPYETIRDIIFDLLGQDGKPSLLRQRFDLQTDELTKGLKGRNEIVFEPVS